MKLLSRTLTLMICFQLAYGCGRTRTKVINSSMVDEGTLNVSGTLAGTMNVVSDMLFPRAMAKSADTGMGSPPAGGPKECSEEISDSDKGKVYLLKIDEKFQLNGGDATVFEKTQAGPSRSDAPRDFVAAFSVKGKNFDYKIDKQFLQINDNEVFMLYYLPDECAESKTRMFILPSLAKQDTTNLNLDYTVNIQSKMGLEMLAMGLMMESKMDPTNVPEGFNLEDMKLFLKEMLSISKKMSAFKLPKQLTHSGRSIDLKEYLKFLKADSSQQDIKLIFGNIMLTSSPEFQALAFKISKILLAGGSDSEFSLEEFIQQAQDEINAKLAVYVEHLDEEARERDVLTLRAMDQYANFVYDRMRADLYAAFPWDDDNSSYTNETLSSVDQWFNNYDQDLLSLFFLENPNALGIPGFSEKADEAKVYAMDLVYSDTFIYDSFSIYPLDENYEPIIPLIYLSSGIVGLERQLSFLRKYAAINPGDLELITADDDDSNFQSKVDEIDALKLRVTP